MTTNCQKAALFVARYSSLVIRCSLKAKNMETGNGHVASTVSLFFTNDERRITSNVAFDSESDNS